MDERSQQEFDRIVEKNINDLNQEEIGFLRARRSYLKKAQLEEYKSILEPRSQTSINETAKSKHATK